MAKYTITVTFETYTDDVSIDLIKELEYHMAAQVESLGDGTISNEVDAYNVESTSTKE